MENENENISPPSSSSSAPSSIDLSTQYYSTTIPFKTKSRSSFTPRKIADTHFHTPCHLFVYGTLMDPEVLQTILSLQETPTFEEGWIAGFRIKMWGIYPALVPCDEGRVSGMACRVETEEQFQRLAEYETSAYTWCGVRVRSTSRMDGWKPIPERLSGREIRGVENWRRESLIWGDIGSTSSGLWLDEMTSMVTSGTRSDISPTR